MADDRKLIVQGKLRVIGVSNVGVDRDGELLSASVQMAAIYADDVPGDRNYAKYTPAAKFELTVTNPDVVAELAKVGGAYYVYLVPASLPGAESGFVLPDAQADAKPA